MDAAFANGLAAIIDFLLNMVQVLVIASVLISWVGADSRNSIVQMIYQATEPMYRPIRRFTSRFPGPFDWAPLVVLLIIVFLQKSVVFYLRQYATYPSLP